MLNMQFHKKKNPLAVTTLQLNERRNNRYIWNFFQSLC